MHRTKLYQQGFLQMTEDDYLSSICINTIHPSLGTPSPPPISGSQKQELGKQHHLVNP